MSAGWRLVKLSEVCEIQRGGSPRPISDYITDAEDGINWIKIGDVPVGAKYLLTTKEKIKPEGAKRSRQVKSGDFLLSNSMSFGRPYILRTSGCIHDGWLVLRDKENQLNEDYLYHVLSSDFVYAQFKKFAVGAVVKNLNIEVVEKVEIPLPPLPEQIRIAAILDQADALRVKRREALAQLDSLTQAIFIEMFGDPVTNPKGFTQKSLGELIKFEGGSQPPASVFTSEPSSENIRLVQIRDFKSDCFKTFIPRKLARRFFEEDDVMIGRYGPPVFQILKGLSGSYNVALMKAVPREGLTKNFVYYLLQEKKLHHFVVANSERTAGQSGVNLELLEKYAAYLPPLQLQHQFSKRVDTVDKLKEAQQKSLTELDALFASLQHRAFRGEL